MEVTDAAKQGWPKHLGSAPGLGGASIYEIADCQPHRVGREYGKRSPSRSRTGSAWPAAIQARFFIRVVVSDVFPVRQVVATPIIAGCATPLPRCKIVGRSRQDVTSGAVF